MSGRIEGYSLTEPQLQPWYYTSKGRTFLRPTTTGQVVSWPTNTGNLYVCNADGPKISFRLETNDDIVTSPAESSPYLYIASTDGYLYCMHELTGEEKWRFSTGYSILSSPAIVGEQAYVASRQPALHAVDVETGRELWQVKGVSHFAAQGKDRVYASDRFGNLLTIDAASGALVGRLSVAEGSYTLVNDQTDRIYLVNNVGLIQCLREIGASEPTSYGRRAAREAGDDAVDEEAEAAADEPTPPVDGLPEASPEEEEPEEEEPVGDPSPFGETGDFDFESPFGE